MPAIQLTHNTKVKIDGKVHAVTGNPNQEQILLLDTSSNDITSLSHTALMSKIDAGSAQIIHIKVDEEKRRKRLEKRLKEQLATLPDTERQEFERRCAYVKAIYSFMPIPKSRDRLQPIIDEIAEKQGDPKPPSFPTVCRWLSDYQAAGCDIRALIPSYKQRGNRARRIEEKVLKIIKKAINERFLNLSQGSPTEVLDCVTAAIKEANDLCPSGVRLTAPDIRTIYREIERLPHYEKTAARYGKGVADQVHKIVQKAPVVKRPLERVEIDHTVMNLLLIDEDTGLLIGRPTITVAVDCFTRWVVGFYIGFEPPGWQSVMHCLRHAISGKEDLRKRFPKIKHEWAVCGVPETIVVDNGREFHSKSLEMACEALDIQIQYSPRAAPWYKGTVERSFLTVETTLLPGTNGRRISQLLKKSEYDPTKDAVATLTNLTEAFCMWVVDQYSQVYHCGLKGTPAHAWQKAQETAPLPRTPANQSDLMIVLSNVEEKPVHRYGVELNGIEYQSEELGRLRQRYYKNRSPKFQVNFDPSDLGFIYVRDPETSNFLQVPAKDLAYASGLNLWQQKVILRWQYRQRKNNHTALSLVEAREEIRAILRSAQKAGLSSASSKRVARFNGKGSNKILELSADVTPNEELPFETDEESWRDLDAEFDSLEDEDWGISTNENYLEN